MIDIYPDFYNDVFGPVMQPFSSFHTAGPCRMGYLTYCLLGESPISIEIQIAPEGTFAATFGLHNEDLALLSGSTGHLPNDAVMFSIREYCREHGIQYNFVFEAIEETNHHTAAKITMTAKSGKTVSAITKSVGGGLVETFSVNGYPLESSGNTYVLLVFDTAQCLDFQSLKEQVANAVDILDEGFSEQEGKGRMFWFQSPDDPTGLLADFTDAAVLRPVTAVINNRGRRPQLFKSMVEWRSLAKEQGKSMAEIAIEYEMASSGWSREQVIAYMRDELAVKMRRATGALYEENLPLPPATPFSEKQYENWEAFTKKGTVFSGDTISKALYYANSSSLGIPGVEFVPGPMGTGGGLIYSVLRAAQENFGYLEEDLLRGLFIAAGVGAIGFTRSQPGGANVGCMGEMGLCGAMAAAALTEMAGGTPEQVEASASMFLMISMGWPCDPVPGAKSMPCGDRLYTVIAMSLVYSDIARSGKDPVFPFHEVLDAADAVGRQISFGSGQTDGHRSCPSAKSCMNAFSAWHRSKSK